MLETVSITDSKVTFCKLDKIEGASNRKYCEIEIRNTNAIILVMCWKSTSTAAAKPHCCVTGIF